MPKVLRTELVLSCADFGPKPGGTGGALAGAEGGDEGRLCQRGGKRFTEQRLSLKVVAPACLFVKQEP